MSFFTLVGEVGVGRAFSSCAFGDEVPIKEAEGLVEQIVCIDERALEIG